MLVRKARAIYTCKADDDQELSFNEEAIIVNIVEADDEGWFEGTLEGTKTRGLFPGNYVEFFEEEEKKNKLPPKPPLRNGTKIINSIPSSNDNDSIDTKPKKLSDTIAKFEQMNIDDKKPLIKPKQKIYPMKKPDSDIQEREVIIPPISVDSEKQNLVHKARVSPPLLSQTQIKPKIPLKPKPTNTPPTLPSRPTIDKKPSLPPTTVTTDKKPPLPPRKNSSLDDSLSISDFTTKAKPSIQNSDLTAKAKSSIQNSDLTAKAKLSTQKAAGEGAKQGVSVGFEKLRGNLDDSKYGKKKFPGQKALFDKAEGHAQSLAEKEAKKKADEMFDKNINDKLNNDNKPTTSKPPPLPARNTDISPPLPARNTDISPPLPTRNTDISPPLPTRNTDISPPLPARNTDVSPPLPARSNDIKIPRRPASHNTHINPFGENHLSEGISSDARKRYEIVFDANKDDNYYIDGAKVKAIYLRSRLDNKTLSKLWNLLDTDEDGWLSRNEFCVGMFLIDERLRGHPIPDELPNELLE